MGRRPPKREEVTVSAISILGGTDYGRVHGGGGGGPDPYTPPYLHRTEERFFCKQIPQRQTVSWLGFTVGGKYEKGRPTVSLPPIVFLLQFGRGKNHEMWEVHVP